MSVSPQKPASQEEDLEATAELPILDLDVPADGATDTVAVIAVPAAVPDLTESLRDVESHLKRKTERLRELEGQLAVAEAAEQELRSDLEKERRAAADQLKDERRSSAELLERERAAAAAQLESERSTAAAQLDSERKVSTERLERAQQEAVARLDAERRAAASAAEEVAGRLTVAEKSLAEARATIESRDKELVAVRSQLAEHEQQVAELGRTTAQQAIDLRNQGRDLEELRRRAERQIEALSHTQGFRGVLEGLLADREEALTGIEARQAAELAARDARVAGEQKQSAEREATLKAELEATSAAMAQASEEREKQLRSGHAAREQALARELETLRKETSEKIAELESSLGQRIEELAGARQQLEAAGKNGSELSARIEAQRAEIEQQREELSGLRANDEAALACIGVNEKQGRRIGELERELQAAQAQSKQFEQELQIAREQIQRLESEARASMSLLGNLQQDMARLGRDDSGSRPVLKLVGAEELPERHLVSEEGGIEVGHPLGRRTSIGRTSDNDIQIEAAYVSRHHAVILGSAQHCIVEDLHSMNGVLVNGRRISRHALHDGDVVTIGRSVFRFQQTS